MTAHRDALARVIRAAYYDEPGEVDQPLGILGEDWLRAADAVLAAGWRPPDPAPDRLRERIEALFSGGPDTACHTVWRDGVEHVAVPMDDLQTALAAPDPALAPDPAPDQCAECGWLPHDPDCSLAAAPDPDGLRESLLAAAKRLSRSAGFNQPGFEGHEYPSDWLRAYADEVAPAQAPDGSAPHG